MRHERRHGTAQAIQRLLPGKVRHQTRLHGFFIKAAVKALKEVPQVNAKIDGTDIVENLYYDISVAIGTDKGLVVPVLRDCDRKTLPELELELAALAEKARKGTLSMQDLQGGCFTISNGGTYGSLLSTPILNPPQSGFWACTPSRNAPSSGTAKSPFGHDVPGPLLRPPPGGRETGRTIPHRREKRRGKPGIRAVGNLPPPPRIQNPGTNGTGKTASSPAPSFMRGFASPAVSHVYSRSGFPDGITGVRHPSCLKHPCESK